MRPVSIAHLIAQTLCECDGKDWENVVFPERERYIRIAILAQDRIRTALTDEQHGPDLSHHLLTGTFRQPEEDVGMTVPGTPIRVQIDDLPIAVA